MLDLLSLRASVQVFRHLKRLEDVDLSRNHLDALPSEICTIPYLKVEKEKNKEPPFFAFCSLPVSLFLPPPPPTCSLSILPYPLPLPLPCPFLSLVLSLSLSLVLEVLAADLNRLDILPENIAELRTLEVTGFRGRDGAPPPPPNHVAHLHSLPLSLKPLSPQTSPTKVLTVSMNELKSLPEGLTTLKKLKVPNFKFTVLLKLAVLCDAKICLPMTSRFAVQ